MPLLIAAFAILVAFCFLTFSKFFNLVYYTGFLGKSKKFIQHRCIHWLKRVVLAT